MIELNISIGALGFALIFLVLLVIEMRKDMPSKNKTYVYGGGLLVSLGVWLWNRHEADENEIKQCAFTTEVSREQCATLEPRFPAIVLFKAAWCPHCHAVSCPWEELTQLIETNSVPVNVYTVDQENMAACLKFKDGIVPGFPTIRYYYDAEKYADFPAGTERTTENLSEFINTQLTDHVSPAGAGTAKASTATTEKYYRLNPQGSAKPGNYEPLNPELYTPPHKTQGYTRKFH